MKKLLLLLCAFVASVSGAWGQTNLASGKTVSVIYIPSERTAPSAVDLAKVTDGNTGTNVMLPNVGNDIAAISIDLTEANKNTKIGIINVSQDGRHATAFTIYGTNVAPGSYATKDDLTSAATSWTSLASTVNDANPPGDDNVCTKSYAASNNSGFRYIVFVPTAQAYGVSLRQIEVNEYEAPSLNSITVSPGIVVAGTPTAITVNAYDITSTIYNDVEYTLDGVTETFSSAITLTAGTHTIVATDTNDGSIQKTEYIYAVGEGAPAPKSGTANLTVYTNTATPSWTADGGTVLGEELTIGGVKAKAMNLKEVTITPASTDAIANYNRASIAIYPAESFSGAVVVNPNNHYVNKSFVAGEWNVIDYNIYENSSSTEGNVGAVRVIGGTGIDVLISNVVLYYKDPTAIDVNVVDGNAAVTGTINASNKSDLNDDAYASVTAFNLTAATIADGVGAITTPSANAVVIVNQADASKLAGTKNLCYVVSDNWMVFPKNGEEPQTVTFTDNAPLYTGKVYAKDNDVIYQYSRTFTGYATFSFPAAVTIPSGVAAYSFTSYAANTITLTRVEGTTLTKNTPYVLYAESSATISYSGSAVAEDGLDMRTPGTSVNDGITFNTNYGIKETSGDEYIMINNQIKKADGAKIGSFRAYFTGVAAASARAIFDDGVTGINNIQNVEKVLNGKFYNLQGQEVKNPTKGIYIVNGKKVIIK